MALASYYVYEVSKVSFSTPSGSTGNSKIMSKMWKDMTVLQVHTGMYIKFISIGFMILWVHDHYESDLKLILWISIYVDDV